VDVEAIRDRLFWTLWGAAGNGSGAAWRELAVMEVGTGRGGGTSIPPNAIIRYHDELPDDHTLATLRDALGGESSGGAAREGAGLLAVVLFREGLLDAGGRRLAERLAAVARGAAVPLIVNEDVRGGWSARLGIAAGRGGEATRLITADGRVAWRHDGPVDPRALADALREHLRPAPWPLPEPVTAAVPVGAPAPDVPLETEGLGALHLRRLHGRPLVLAFVQPWAASSAAHAGRLERLRAGGDARGTLTALVVDGLDARAAAEWGARHAPSLLPVGDPRGAVAERFGVRLWPTTVMVGDDGIVAGVSSGTDPGALDALERAGVEAAGA
jgi:hypothetical protein